MQLPKGGSYMVAWFQVEHESRRRLCYHTCEHDILKTYWTDFNAPLAQVVHGTRAWNAIGTGGPWDKSMKRSTYFGGQKITAQGRK